MLAQLHTTGNAAPPHEHGVQIALDLDEAELAHTLEALGGVVEILERRSDELVAAIILRDVIAKILREIEEAR